jgi:hypothetical protein
MYEELERLLGKIVAVSISSNKMVTILEGTDRVAVIRQRHRYTINVLNDIGSLLYKLKKRVEVENCAISGVVEFPGITVPDSRYMQLTDNAKLTVPCITIGPSMCLYSMLYNLKVGWWVSEELLEGPCMPSYAPVIDSDYQSKGFGIGMLLTTSTLAVPDIPYIPTPFIVSPIGTTVDYKAIWSMMNG